MVLEICNACPHRHAIGLRRTGDKQSVAACPRVNLKAANLAHCESIVDRADRNGEAILRIDRDQVAMRAAFQVQLLAGS